MSFDPSQLKFEELSIKNINTDYNGDPIYSKIKECVTILNSANATEKSKEEALREIGNIAGDSTESRDLILNNYNVLEPILTILNSDLSQIVEPTMIRNLTFTLSNLVKGKWTLPKSSKFEILTISLPLLSKLIHCQDLDTLTNVLSTLSSLSDDFGGGDPNEIFQKILEVNICPRLIELLGNTGSLDIQIHALRTIGNIITGDDNQTQALLNTLSFLPSLLKLIKSKDRNIRKETCWIISNITADNENQIQQVINAGLITPIIEIIQSKRESNEVKKEVLWVISNIFASGTAEQIEQVENAFCKDGVIKPLINLLNINQDPIILGITLDSIDNLFTKVGKGEQHTKYASIVEDCGGLDKLENMQTHPSHQIYQKALKILVDHFDADTDNDESVMA